MRLGYEFDYLNLYWKSKFRYIYFFRSDAVIIATVANIVNTYIVLISYIGDLVFLVDNLIVKGTTIVNYKLVVPYKRLATDKIIIFMDIVFLPNKW